MTVYKPTNEGQELGGFPLVPAGKHRAAIEVIEEQVNEDLQNRIDEMSADEQKKRRIERVRAQFKITRGEAEGQAVSIFLNLTIDKGLRDYARVLWASKGTTPIEKKHNLAPIEQGWDDSVLRSQKMLKELNLNLVAKEVEVEVKHREGTGRDGEKRIFANVSQVFPLGGGDQQYDNLPASAKEQVEESEEW